MIYLIYLLLSSIRINTVFFSETFCVLLRQHFRCSVKKMFCEDVMCPFHAICLVGDILCMVLFGLIQVPSPGSVCVCVCVSDRGYLL